VATAFIVGDMPAVWSVLLFVTGIILVGLGGRIIVGVFREMALEQKRRQAKLLDGPPDIPSKAGYPKDARRKDPSKRRGTKKRARAKRGDP